MMTKQQFFVDRITEKITAGKYVRGSYLPCERELAEQYSLSRVTVRNGLKKLEAEQIIRPIPRKGYMVISIPVKPKQGTRNIAGLWCSGAFSEHTYELFRSANEVAVEKQFNLFLNYARDDENDQVVCLSKLLENEPEGLMLIPTFSEASGRMKLGNHRLIKALRESGIPLVMLDRDFPETDLSCVVNDEYRGGQLAASHLASLGHRNILLLRTGFDYYISFRRFGGFHDFCRQQGMKVWDVRLPLDPQNPAAIRFESYLELRNEIREMIDGNKISAVMTNLSCIFPEILADMEDRELDFLVYDCNMKGYAKRRIWSVDRPIEKISAMAVKLLLEQISCGSQPICQIRLEPVIRKIPEIMAV